MKKIIARVVVLAVVFLVGIYALTNSKEEETETTTESMASSTLPTMVLQSDGISMNALYGYTQEMDAASLRETITPLSEDRNLVVSIQPYDAEIKGISYEVRSLDSTRLVEETTVEDYEENQENINATFQIKNLLENNQEYLLKIIVTTDSYEEVYYYTRIIYQEELNVSAKMEFVQQFHENTFQKDDSNDIINYLEPNQDANNNSFETVTIHSNLEQVTWGDLSVEVCSEEVIDILEIDETTASMKMDYTAKTIDDDGEEKYYSVTEFYRIRYTASRIYLLDYNRTMDEYFQPSDNTLSQTNILLGIQNSDIDYLENEDATRLCFISQNELWAYSSEAHSMSRVFSFLEDSYTDKRDCYNQHAIKLITMSSGGDIDFMVYGYMNRGRHEGTVGVSIYHYDAATNTIEEKVFIQSKESYQVLKETIGKFSYVNKSDTLYIMVNGNVYNISLLDCSYKEIITDIADNAYVVSEDSQLFAWQNEESCADTTKLSIINLETNEVKEIEVSDDKRIKSIGFMGTDFIYGEANVSDLTVDVGGDVLFRMSTIHILDQNNEEIKQYSSPNMYVIDAVIEDNMINLTRVTKDDGVYTAASDDHILNNQTEEEYVVSLDTYTTDVEKTQIEFVLPYEMKEGDVKILTPKEVVFPEDRSIDLDIGGEEDETSLYYVYGQGSLAGIYTSISDAVKAADDLTGVVVDQNQNYIWQRGNRQVRTQITEIEATQAANGNTLATCLDLLLNMEDVYISSLTLLNSGQTAGSILKENLSGTTVDLTRCELDAALYYVSEGIPVIAKTDSTNYVLIVGYNELNTIVMNPATGTIYKIGMNDSETLFEQAGNVFISYLPKEE